MAEDRIVVVNGVRTPFARARTVFQKMPPSALGGVVLRETVARSDVDPKLIDETYFGIVSAPAEGSNIAREALFDSGLPPTIAATTINRYCASAAEATAAIAAKIAAGQIEVGLAGGVESISSVRALFSQEATDYFQDLMKTKTTGQKLGMMANFKAGYLAPHAPGIKEPTTGLTMGQSADLMAREFKVGREEQDQYAMESHHKAAAAWEKGFYKSHVVPVATPDGKIIEKDTDIRADSNMEKLSSLRPVFFKDGTITAGNASPLTDGASALLLMKESKARSLGMKILGAIRGYSATAVDIKKEPLLIGPAYAIPKALKQAGIEWGQLDIVEMHEAFAAQVLATIKAIESDQWAKDKLGASKAIGKVDRSRLNVNGGSIPLGHPFGATGVRCILQCLHELRNRKKNLGLVSICAAGGIGSVMVLEAMD
ncbi:MAG TPA: acetyl-CoA C-acyltransferase [Bdellovibrionota bacterium]|nr:acetyl-CoA C-acyltransferase [Bdellovibrionota bacterium]